MKSKFATLVTAFSAFAATNLWCEIKIDFEGIAPPSGYNAVEGLYPSGAGYFESGGHFTPSGDFRNNVFSPGWSRNHPLYTYNGSSWFLLTHEFLRVGLASNEGFTLKSFDYSKYYEDHPGCAPFTLTGFFLNGETISESFLTPSHINDWKTKILPSEWKNLRKIEFRFTGPAGNGPYAVFDNIVIVNSERPQIDSINIAGGPRGKEIPNFSVSGINFGSGAKIEFRGPISTNDIYIANYSEQTDQKITGTLVISGSSASGPYDVIVKKEPSGVESEPSTKFRVFSSYKQGDAPWGNEDLLNSTEKIGSKGCLLACTAMLLTAFGHATDPLKLNNLLKSETGPNGEKLFKENDPNLDPGLLPKKKDRFGQNPPVPPGPPVTFSELKTFKSQLTAGQFVNGAADTTFKDLILLEIDSLIKTYGPIILKIPSVNWGAGSKHYCVAYAVVEEDILFAEPGWNATSSFSKLSAEYRHYVNAYLAKEQNREGTKEARGKWIDTPLLSSQLFNRGGSLKAEDDDFTWLAGANYTFARETNSASAQPAIKGKVNSPVELVITDSYGRRVGYDPTSDTRYAEIPNSIYSREEEIAPADDSPFVTGQRYGHLIFRLGEFVQGLYNIKIFGLDAGIWSVQFGVEDPLLGSNPWRYSLAGIAEFGSRETFSQYVEGPNVGVVLGGLSGTYDGKPKAVLVATIPSGLDFQVTYNGIEDPPVKAGSYGVGVTVTGFDEDNEQDLYGFDYATLVVRKANATVGISNLTQAYDGSLKFAVTTTVPEGLAVVVTYGGSATPPTLPGIYSVVATVNDVNFEGSATGVLTIAAAGPVPDDVTPHLQITRGGLRLNRTTQRYVQTITIKNTSPQPIAGPVSLVFDHLSSNATLYGITGTTTLMPPSGSPFINLNIGVDGLLSPNETVTHILEFTNATNQSISYSLRALAGPGVR